jgi:hypothetical protein
MIFRCAANHVSLGMTVFDLELCVRGDIGGEFCELEQRRCRTDLNRFPLAYTGDPDSLAGEFLEGFFVSKELVAPVTVYENVAGALPDAQARTLCRTQMRILQVTGAAVGVSHHSLVEAAGRDFRRSWGSELGPFRGLSSGERR